MLPFKGGRFFTFVILWGMVSFFIASGDGQPKTAVYEADLDETDILKNLLTAYDIESNTHNLYLLFSEKAKEEGYQQVALLFRAALGSVSVQMENHAEAIKNMGGTPKNDLKPPIVKATAENLQEAIKRESDKFNDVYPAFLVNARQKRDKTALRTFNFSKSIAGDHLNFFKEASANLEGWKNVNVRFWVCSICGNVVTALNFSECPVCFNPLSKYGEVK